MRTYIIKRLLLVIPTMFIASLMVFFLIRLIPGDIVDLMLTELTAGVPIDRAVIEHELGLDVPVLEQYGRWIGFVPRDDGSFSGILQGDLGNSLWKKTPVINSIAARWPVTLELTILSIIIGLLIALPIGIYSALRQDTPGDYIGRSFAILCIAVPYFWLATMIIVFPSLWWNYTPPIMLIPFTEDPTGNLKMFILPAICLGMALAGATMRMLRTMVLEVMRQDYIRTAWSKGLRERVIVVRHVLKNALIPVITLIGIQISWLVGGTVIIEDIFCLPGIGQLIVRACLRRDYTVVSGVMLLFAAVMILINLLIDLTYGFLDPRIRYR